jgi:hypothetical protein
MDSRSVYARNACWRVMRSARVAARSAPAHNPPMKTLMTVLAAAVECPKYRVRRRVHVT